MSKKIRYKNAAVTIEVSILMPFLVIVILIFFYFVLYMYNRGIMQNAICRGAKQIFYNTNEDNQTIENACSHIVLNDLEGHLVAVKDLELMTEVSSQEIFIELTGTLEVPGIISLESFQLNEIWDYRLQWRESRLNSAKLLIYGQQIGGVFQKIQEEFDYEMEGG